jgi:di/tricarboxylate transporter
MGSPARCLQKGVGIGRSRKARKGSPYLKWVGIGVLSLILMTALFLTLYFSKPKFIQTKDKKPQIDWGLFMAFYIPMCCVIILVAVGVIWKFFR